MPLIPLLHDSRADYRMLPSEVQGVSRVLSAFVSAYSFRHWQAQRLIRLGASIDPVQFVLGHARAQTTKDIYAPEPNVSQILQLEGLIQDVE
jgi:integrase